MWLVFLTLLEASNSESSNKSSTPHDVGGEKLGGCCTVCFKETCCAFWLDGSLQYFSVSFLHFERQPSATRIPVARYLWWFAARVLTAWIDSSQSWQKRALSSTQKIKAVFSCHKNVQIRSVTTSCLRWEYMGKKWNICKQFRALSLLQRELR